MCNCNRNTWRFFATLTVIAAIGALIWYGSMTDSQKAALKNFASQIPDLPGRFMV
jgi:hypothetical protein